MKKSFDIAIVGTGIVGLAIGYEAAKQGLNVIFFERHPQAIGATVRNFGLIWPIGQESASIYRAMRSRDTWLDLAKKANFWVSECGSLHLAYHPDEAAVLEEFAAGAKGYGYHASLLTPQETIKKSAAVNPDGLLAALWSDTELNLDPRQATLALHSYLQNLPNVTFRYNTAITGISGNRLTNGNETWQAERIFVCSGQDFETLYPAVFAQAPLTKCKLQMMRTEPQPEGFQLGPVLCGGLTLQHYDSFSHCRSLEVLKKRFEETMPGYNRFGIHVLLSQTSLGELTIGDSHEYGPNLSPFDNQSINQLILDYLKTFSRLPQLTIAETWHGVYAKTTDGSVAFVTSADEDVTIVNGLGGAGMTLSFGLAQELV